MVSEHDLQSHPESLLGEIILTVDEVQTCLCIISKVLEKCIYNHIYEFISSRIHKLQHGFQQGRSSTTQLVYCYHIVSQALDKHKEIQGLNSSGLLQSI